MSQWADTCSQIKRLKVLSEVVTIYAEALQKLELNIELDKKISATLNIVHSKE